MGEKPRFSIYVSHFFGIGIVFDSFCYMLDISIMLPFCNIDFGFGKNLQTQKAIKKPDG